MKKRILSGMRPTGPLHLGHFVGALKNWVSLQDEYDCFYMIADWHALMSEYEKPQDIKENIINCAIDWMSCGLSPEKCSIFVQSDVPMHLELYMTLSCLTPLSWLERCPTYKEQLREIKTRDLTTYAFLGYPVLQASDIMIYKSQVVPVGVDQAAHLELTREIVRRFNKFYGDVFPEPETLLTKFPKLLGLDNRKMSKSYGNYIALSDSPEIIEQKTSRMVTDPKRVYRTDKGHPHECNVYSYYGLFAEQTIVSDVEKKCKNAETGCTDCKKQLAHILINLLEPVRNKRKVFLKDKKVIYDVLEKGAKKAIEVTSNTMEEVRKKIGFI